MNFIAEIEILPHANLLDPQGKAVNNSLPGIGIQNVEDVRVGKFITLKISANSAEEANTTAENACKNLLANQVMEFYRIRISQSA